jgi:regulator of cell morphogenesis and NO signaling
MPEDTITSFYERDHDRLDELFRQFQHHKRIDYAKAKPFFRDFKFGLQRHILWEEEILFPFFEQKTGMAGGPTEVMRMEHLQIGAALEAIHDMVKRQDPESDEQEHRLLQLLSAHNLKEEQILYPMIDKAGSEAERASIFRSMEGIPEERYKVCCSGPTQK